MRLVLVSLHISETTRAIPLGPAMLKSVLRREIPEGLTTDIVDVFIHETPEACAEKILALEPRFVGLSIYVWNRPLALATAAVLKARNPALIIFAGGPEPTADIAGVQADPSVDFVLPGESEQIIVPFMRALLAGAPREEAARSFIPAPIKDLAALPSPFLDGTLDLDQYPSVLWEHSRGCAFKCSFCFESRGTAGVRRFPRERLLAELRLFEEHLVSQVFVLDPTFNWNMREAKEILRCLAEISPTIHFYFEARSEFLDEELAELFAGIRCTLQLGLQSADVEVLKKIDRKFNRKDFEAKILLLHEAGCTYGFDLIYGLPGDTLDGFLASLDFAMSLAPNHLDIFRLSVLPGTALFDAATGFGLERQSAPPYRVLSSPTFPAADLEIASGIAEGFELFYNQGKAVPWFAIVAESLGWAPSKFFRQFAAFRKTHPGTDAIALQTQFLKEAFAKAGKKKEGAVALDLVTYFGRSAELLAAAEAPALAQPGRAAAPALPALTAEFHHDPEALLGLLDEGLTDLDALAEELLPAPCQARFTLADGDVAVQVVA